MHSSVIMRVLTHSNDHNAANAPVAVKDQLTELANNVLVVDQVEEKYSLDGQVVLLIRLGTCNYSKYCTSHSSSLTFVLRTALEMIFLLVFLQPIFVLAVDNGIGLTPPMGWRHWKAFYANINQVTFCL